MQEDTNYNIGCTHGLLQTCPIIDFQHRVENVKNSNKIMQEDNKYDIGYTHGVNQARPIVDLEHRVKRVEHNVNWIGWTSIVSTAIMLVPWIWYFSRGVKKGLYPKKDEKKDYKEKKEDDGDGPRNGTSRIDRRHIRDFDIWN